MCDALIANGVVIKLSPIRRTVCAGGGIKHDADWSCVCDAWQTVDPYELFTMGQNNINSQPYHGVCDIRHKVHSELVAIRQHNRNGQTYQVVCNMRYTAHLDELFVLSENNKNGRPDQGVCDRRHIVHSDELFAMIQNIGNDLS